jgi:hypothetical protein
LREATAQGWGPTPSDIRSGWEARKFPRNLSSSILIFSARGAAQLAQCLSTGKAHRNNSEPRRRATPVLCGVHPLTSRPRMERRRPPLVSIPPLGRDFQGIDTTTRLSLGMVASTHSSLPFHPARSLQLHRVHPSHLRWAVSYSERQQGQTGLIDMVSCRRDRSGGST